MQRNPTWQVVVSIGLGDARRRAIPQAVVRRAEKRAALEDLARDRHRERGVDALRERAPLGLRGVQQGRCGSRRRRTSRTSTPRRCRTRRTGRSRSPGTRRPARCARSRRAAGSARGTRPARCSPSASRRARTRRPTRRRAPSSPPRAACSHSASVGSVLAGPRRVRLDVLVGDVDDRVVVASVERALRALGVAPVGARDVVPPLRAVVEVTAAATS